MVLNTDKSGIDLLKEYMPEITNVKTILLMIFPTVIILFLVYFLNMVDWWAPLLVGIAINVLAYWTMSRITRNAEKIRESYRNKYGAEAYGKFFYHYLIPAIPPNMLVWFLIIMVENNNFFPMFYPSYNNNLLYQTIIPWQLAFPLAIFLLALYPLMSRDSVNGGFTLDTELFLYIIYPDKAKKLQGGLYQYIRHPHYASGIYMCFGFVVLSQNLIALILALLFAINYYFVAQSEDKELIRRYGSSFETYVKNKPHFLPQLKDLNSFFRLLFIKK